MKTYANLEDLESRWKVLNKEEQTKAATLLIDASAHLTSRLTSKLGADFDVDETLAHNLKVVTCNIVMRSMNTRPDFFGISQSQMTAGPYSETLTPINSTGDMRLTDEEERLLGLKSQTVAFINPYLRSKETC